MKTKLFISVLIVTVLACFFAFSASAAVEEISTPDQLIAIMSDSSKWTGSYKLTADIDLSGLTQTSMTTFSGTFDGNGKTIKGLNIAGGLITTMTGGTVKNLTLDGTVTGTANAVGAFVGTLKGGSIINCVNKATINVNVERVGGIVGYYYPAANSVAIIDGCINYSDITAKANVGGIVGRFEPGSASTNGKHDLTNCANYGDITGTAGTSSNGSAVGGIIGLYSQNAKTSTTLINNCYNEGAISGKYKYTGGIAGYFRSYQAHSNIGDITVSNCMNVGSVHNDQSGGASAGISGTCNGSTGTMLFENNYNAGAVSNGGGSYVGPITAAIASASNQIFRNNYWLDGSATYNVEKYGAAVSAADSVKAESFEGFSAEYWIINKNGPELKSFHTHDFSDNKFESTGTEKHAPVCYCGGLGAEVAHVDANGDNTCDVCEGVLECDHVNTVKTWEVVTPSTCVVAGLERERCVCTELTGNTRELPLDTDAHMNLDYVWSVNAETGAYEIVCPDCNAAFKSQTEAPTVYVAGSSATTDGLTAATGVHTLVEAVERIAATGGTVWVAERCTISGQKIILPAHEKEITFRGNVLSNGLAETGLYNSNTSTHAEIHLGGPTTFDTIVFRGAGLTRIFANWNDLTMGYIRSMDNAKAELFVGSNAPKADNLEEKDVTLDVEGASITSTSTGTVFYQRIFLGDAVGANGIAINNKKVTLNARKGHDHDFEVGTLYAVSTSASHTNIFTENSQTIINLYDGSSISIGRTGNKTLSNGDATSSLDYLEINLFDNSTLKDDFYIQNVKEAVLNISTEAEGRTTKLSKQLVGFKYGSFKDEEATITVNADSHASTFNGNTIARMTTAGNDGTNNTVTNNITDVCTWDEGVITTEPTVDTNGTIKYTCTVCGKTKTGKVEFECAEHKYVVKADGTYYCANGCALSAPTSPVVVSVAPVTAVNGTVTVTVFVDATAPITANRFEINAPEGFTLVSAESVLGAANEATNGFSLTTQNALTLPYSAALLNMSFEDSTINTAVLNLTFSVADTVESGAVITVESLETYNTFVENIETAAVSAEITVAKTLEEDTYKYGISATLANELLLEYLIRLDNDLVFDDCYLVVEHYKADSATPSVNTVRYHNVNQDDTQNVYRFYAPGVAAKEMNDRIVATFYVEVAGELYVAGGFEKNIVDYYSMAYAALNGNATGQAPAFLNTLYALLNYGAEAQRYFKYNTENLVNSVLPEDEQKTEFTAEATASLVVNNDCEGEAYRISSIAPYLEDRVVMALNIVANGEIAQDLKFVGRYDDVNGKTQNFEIPVKVVTDDGETSITVDIDVVAAKDLRQTITGAIYDGDIQVSDSVSFSFESYANLAAANEKNICNAILNYCDAAKELFSTAATKQ